MRWRLALLVLLPSIGLVLLATIVVRAAEDAYTEQRGTRGMVHLVQAISAVDGALGEEGIVASGIRGEPATWDRFIRDEAAKSDRLIEALTLDPHVGKEGNNLTEAMALLQDIADRRQGLRESDRDPTEVTERYDSVRQALRDALQLELAKHNGDGSAALAAGLIALVEARSAHLDERIVVAAAIDEGAWRPGHYARALNSAALQRDRVQYAHTVALTDVEPRVIRDELARIREQLVLSDDVSGISDHAWRRSSDAWLIVLNTEINRELVSMDERLTELEQVAAHSRDGALTLVAFTLVAVCAATVAAVVRLTRDVEHRLRTQAREAQALEAVAQGRDLDEILDDLALLAGTDSSGQPTHRFTHEPVDRDTESVTPPGCTDLWLEQLTDSDEPPVPERATAIGLAVMAQQRFDDEAHLERRATTDELTGSLNRFTVLERVNAAVEQNTSSGHVAALFSIDLDGFKAINDRHGNAVGDDVLRQTASRLHAWCSDLSGVSGRTGSDEFLAFIPDVEAHDVLHIASGLSNSVSMPTESEGVTHRLSASIGCVTTRPSVSADDLLLELDDALAVARSLGVGRTVISDEELRRSIHDANLLRTAVKDGFDHYEFEPWFQPLWEDQGETLTGFEALVRWRRADGSVESPGAFLTTVEELNLLPKLDGQIFHAVAHQINRWQQAGIAPRHVGVNVSSERLEHPGFVRETIRAIEETGCSPSALVIEVTESGLMSDIDSNSHRLQELRDLGMWIAADDFGQGYSSLGYLSDLPIDVVKLDRVFIDHIDTSPTNQAIVQAVVGLAGSLDLQLIAEGVERPEELAWISNQGVPVVQGYLLGRPMPASEATALLEQHRSGPERGELAARLAQAPTDLADSGLEGLSAEGVLDRHV